MSLDIHLCRRSRVDLGPDYLQQGIPRLRLCPLP